MAAGGQGETELTAVAHPADGILAHTQDPGDFSRAQQQFRIRFRLHVLHAASIALISLIVNESKHNSAILAHPPDRAGKGEQDGSPSRCPRKTAENPENAAVSGGDFGRFRRFPSISPIFGD